MYGITPKPTSSATTATKTWDSESKKPSDAGLAKAHYEDYFHDGEKEIACEECHKGPGLSGMIQVKVIQATQEMYQYFVLGDRSFPHRGDYSNQNCMKSDCHPNPQQAHTKNITGKRCIKCHSGHNSIHEAAKKQTVTPPLQCTRCHTQKAIGVHQEYETSENCLECHKSQHPSTAKISSYEKCGQCHSEYVGVSKPYPGYEDSCESCHGETRHNISITEFKNKGITVNTCLNCHQGAHGNATSQLNCFSCHKNITKTHFPSPPDLNKAPYINISSQLCSKCHGKSVHTQHPSAQGTSEQCSDCHTSVHGGPNNENCQRCHEDLSISAVNYPASTPNDLCAQCHRSAQSSIKKSGKAHRQINCTSCHTKHQQLPNCSRCHGTPHGSEVTECGSCHANGHAPLNVSVPAVDCQRCHSEQQETLNASPSAHSGMDCTSCHDETKQFEHGYVPNCSECHGTPHGSEAVQCYDCHEGGHNPTQLNYSTQIASSKCGSCHNDTYNDLVEGNNSHTDIGCGGCHEEHGEVPTCESCHGSMHGIESPTNEKCLGCHQDAHILKYLNSS